MDVLENMKKTMQSQMDIVRFLCTCGEFDKSKMEKYLSMSDEVGMKWNPQEKEQMLNAKAFFLPKHQSDGTILDGFNQLRIEFVQVHAGAVSQNIKLITQLFPDASTVDYIQSVTDEMKELASNLSV